MPSSLCSCGRMVAVLVAKIGPEELFQLWKFLVNNYPLGFIAAGAVSLAAFVGLILVPAWSSYSRLWERLAATVLSVYVLAVLVGVGVVGALAAVYLWG